MQQIKANIISNQEILPGVFLIWLDAPGIAAEARPGQFVMVSCNRNNECILRRPLSIHQTVKDKLALLYAVVGKGTEILTHYQAGDELDLLGPLGNGFSIQPESRKILLVAGGMGIAPLVFLAQEALKKGCSVTLLLGAQRADMLYPIKLLPDKTAEKEVQNSSLSPIPSPLMGEGQNLSPFPSPLMGEDEGEGDLKTITTTDDGSAGTRGRVTQLLPDYYAGADQIFVCGPLPMYLNIDKQYSSLLKEKPVQVSLEVRMGCGLGVCYSCTIKTRDGLKQVCKDGPVFNFADIDWSSLA